MYYLSNQVLCIMVSVQWTLLTLYQFLLLERNKFADLAPVQLFPTSGPN